MPSIHGSHNFLLFCISTSIKMFRYRNYRQHEKKVTENTGCCARSCEYLESTFFFHFYRHFQRNFLPRTWQCESFNHKIATKHEYRKCQHWFAFGKRVYVCVSAREGLLSENAEIVAASDVLLRVYEAAKIQATELQLQRIFKLRASCRWAPDAFSLIFCATAKIVTATHRSHNSANNTQKWITKNFHFSVSFSFSPRFSFASTVFCVCMCI